jgi:hypothetical protein
MSQPIEDQLEAIKAALADFAAAQGGQAFVASDMVHMWEIGYNAQNKLRVVIVCTGEEARGEFSLAAATHRVDRQFGVLVTRGRTFTMDRGQGLTQTVGNAPPLFSLVAQVRDLIRAMLNISVEFPVDYKSFKSFPQSQQIIDAYFIEFSCATDLSLIEAVPDDGVPLPP